MGFTHDLLSTQKSGEIHPSGQSLNISQMFNGASWPCSVQTFLDKTPQQGQEVTHGQVPSPMGLHLELTAQPPDAWLSQQCTSEAAPPGSRPFSC